MKSISLLLLLSLTLAGCATAVPPEEPIVPAVIATPTMAPPVVTVATEPAATPPPTREIALPSPEAAAPDFSTAPETAPTPNSSLVVYGRAEDGAFFHGAPDAPVTLIDYSDFL